ncbi:UNVERIFIED_CONTAM: hypothetical protein FKN15_041580 [Acipenser sinensis]
MQDHISKQVQRPRDNCNDIKLARNSATNYSDQQYHLFLPRDRITSLRKSVPKREKLLIQHPTDPLTIANELPAPQPLFDERSMNLSEKEIFDLFEKMMRDRITSLRKSVPKREKLLIQHPTDPLTIANELPAPQPLFDERSMNLSEKEIFDLFEKMMTVGKRTKVFIAIFLHLISISVSMLLPGILCGAVDLQEDMNLNEDRKIPLRGKDLSIKREMVVQYISATAKSSMAQRKCIT